jgi:hypothetical protein
MTFKLMILDPACNLPTINGADKVTKVVYSDQVYELGSDDKPMTWEKPTTDPLSCKDRMGY